jgi:hypothetical protein
VTYYVKNFRFYRPQNQNQPSQPSSSPSGFLASPRSMMSSLQTLQVFRSCTASLPSRTLAQSSMPRPQSRRMAIAMAARRHYSSGGKASEGNWEPSKEEKRQEQQEPTLSESDLFAKLQAKEQEVVDLTVRITLPLRSPFSNERSFLIGPPTIPPSRFPQSSTQRSTRKGTTA